MYLTTETVKEIAERLQEFLTEKYTVVTIANGNSSHVEVHQTLDKVTLNKLPAIHICDTYGVYCIYDNAYFDWHCRGTHLIISHKSPSGADLIWIFIKES